MLRALKEGRPWPQTKVHGAPHDADSEWPAVRAAHRQLGYPDSLNTIDETLQRQYNRYESRRQRLRENLFDRLDAGFKALEPAADQVYVSALEAFSRAATQPGSEDLQLVLRALLELIGPGGSGEMRSPSPEILAKTFCSLIKSASDRDDPDVDEDGDGVIDEFEADSLWERLSARLRTEYGRTRGGFARLLYGDTPPLRLFAGVVCLREVGSQYMACVHGSDGSCIDSALCEPNRSRIPISGIDAQQLQTHLRRRQRLQHALHHSPHRAGCSAADLAYEVGAPKQRRAFSVPSALFSRWRSHSRAVDTARS